jgi:hypothetical protein
MTQLQTPTPTLRRDERGMALALAIFALVIIATLVAGVFFLARLEQRSGSNALWSTQAAEAADAGLNETLANWSSGGFNSLAIGGSPITLAPKSLGANSRYSTTVRRVSSQVFLIQSRGERTGGGGVLAGTSLGRLVRLVTPNLTANAAVTSVGGVNINGNITVNGANTPPVGWGPSACPAVTDTVASIQSASTVPPPYGSATLVGNPGPKGVVENDPSVTAAYINNLFSSLSAAAGSSTNITYVGNWSSAMSPAPVGRTSFRPSRRDLPGCRTRGPGRRPGRGRRKTPRCIPPR